MKRSIFLMAIGVILLSACTQEDLPDKLYALAGEENISINDVDTIGLNRFILDGYGPVVYFNHEIELSDGRIFNDHLYTPSVGSSYFISSYTDHKPYDGFILRKGQSDYFEIDYIVYAENIESKKIVYFKDMEVNIPVEFEKITLTKLEDNSLKVDINKINGEYPTINVSTKIGIHDKPYKILFEGREYNEERVNNWWRGLAIHF